ncbi:MAG: hypothetical protein WCO44_05905 [Bacteroidota bacterium]
MSCIKPVVIRKYIDKAASAKEIETVVKHLAACRECAARVNELQRQAELVKNTMNILAEDEVAVPGFIAPVRISRSLAAPRRNRYALSFMAASVLLCLVMAVVFTLRTPAQQQIVVVHTADREINANQTVTKQQMVINVIDANRKVTSYPLK